MEGEQSNGRRNKQNGKVEERMDYVSVKFNGNSSKKLDGKEVKVPGKMVIKLGELTAEGLEKAEVHWPGKGGKLRRTCGGTLFYPTRKRKRRMQKAAPAPAQHQKNTGSSAT